MPPTPGLPEYDAMRRRLQSQFSTQRSTADDAMKRRFAAQGMLGSGAYQKSAEMADEQANRDQAEGLQGVDIAEQSELQRRKELGEGRQYQTAEREGAQRFAAEEAAKGRTFQTGEREGAQNFGHAERLGTQDWQQGNIDREYQQNLLTNYINAILGFKDAGLSSKDWLNAQSAFGQIGYNRPDNVFARRG